MPNIKVLPEHSGSFLRCLTEWQNEQSQAEGFASAHRMPPEGTGTDGRALFINVPEPALPFLTRRGIPFERV
jgi:hypothetical protein